MTEESFKLYVMGSGGVGKSALTVRLVQGRFVAAYDPTIEDSYEKLVTVEGKQVRLEIIDTAGQDDFEAIRETYMRQGDGFLVVFSLTDSVSFDAVDGFQRDIKTISEKSNIPIVICGNKCDLTDERQVTNDAVQEYVKSIGAPYFETSAQSGKNVEESFIEVAKLMLNLKNDDDDGGLVEFPETNKQNDKDKDDDKKGKSCCNIQ